ncbi:MAG: septum formation inhibitor Maf [Syntrophomonadaceae bacterium]|nr:septum formation inhibitor Maf [Syntrophomonadaceae bacterium]
MKKIILASASPRRQSLLQQLGVEFTISPANIKENLSKSISPEQLVRTIAWQKARLVLQGLQDGIVIAADTVISWEGRVMGKPLDRDDAFAMLSQLSGHSHQVLTGVCVAEAGDETPDLAVESTSVFFRPLTKEDIDNYLSHEEWIDKAGAYAIQGCGALLVERIEGCFYNVVGLPLNQLNMMLRNKGMDLLGVR